MVEESAAVLGTIGLNWVYTTKAIDANLAIYKITLEATDTPGNMTDKQVTLSSTKSIKGVYIEYTCSIPVAL